MGTAMAQIATVTIISAGRAREPQRLTLDQSRHHGPFGKNLA
jgi:hypothetical protein